MVSPSTLWVILKKEFAFEKANSFHKFAFPKANSFLQCITHVKRAMFGKQTGVIKFDCNMAENSQADLFKSKF